MPISAFRLLTPKASPEAADIVTPNPIVQSNPYAQILDATRDALVQRARNYRTLVVIVSLGSLLLLPMVWVFQNSKPLLALALWPSIVVAFLARDLSAVYSWRRHALARWAEGAVSIKLLVSMVRQAPQLPPQTVEGMLQCLPSWPDTTMPIAARQSLAKVQDLLGRLAVQSLALKSMGCGVAALTVTAAIAAARPSFLAAMLSLPLAWRLWQYASRNRLKQVVSQLQHSLTVTAVNLPAAVWLDQLNRHGLPETVASVIWEAQDKKVHATQDSNLQ